MTINLPDLAAMSAFGARIAEQLTFLSAGAYRFTAEARTETGDPAARMVWTLACASGGRVLASVPAGNPSATSNTWTTISARIDVPEGCPAQWLRLETRAADRRYPTVVWFDLIAISPVS